MPLDILTLEKVTKLAAAAIQAKELEGWTSSSLVKTHAKPPNKHKKKTHAKRLDNLGTFTLAFSFPREERRATVGTEAVPPAVVIRCHFCRSKFATKLDVNEHVRATHKLNRVKTDKSLLYDPRTAAKHSGHAAKRNQEVEPESGDGSKHWGSSFRDNGRFGSHPQFDSMDDESAP